MSSTLDTREFSLNYYRDMLSAAIESNYSFIAFSEIPKALAVRTPFCVLRHDCDNDLVSALEIAKIESSFGVKSTYFVMLRSAMYNLLSRPNSEIVREIRALGHHIGLHFDEALVSGLPADAVNAEVERECALIEAEFGTPIEAVSFHQPGKRILDNDVKINRINTYDKADIGELHYISDSWGVMRADLIEAFRERKFSRLQLLLHTEWWTDNAANRYERWRETLSRLFTQMQSELLAREPAYETPHEIIVK